MKLSEKILAAVRGETVPKSDHDTTVSELATANEKILALESQLASREIDPDAVAEALNTRISELESEVTQLKAEKADLVEKIKTPSRQAAAIIAQTHTTTVNQSVETPEGDRMTFDKLVKAQMSGGKSKADAIQFCVKNFTSEYAEWRNSGKTQTL